MRPFLALKVDIMNRLRNKGIEIDDFGSKKAMLSYTQMWLML